MSQQKLSRRDLLKLLSAAAGAAALSTVPSKWETPVVEIGALPAHAQASGRGAIQGFINLNFPFLKNPKGSPVQFTVTAVGPGQSANANFDHSDEGADVYKYTITGVPPGSWMVKCHPMLSCPRDDSTMGPVTVTIGNTAAGPTFDYDACAG